MMELIGYIILNEIIKANDELNMNFDGSDQNYCSICYDVVLINMVLNEEHFVKIKNILIL